MSKSATAIKAAPAKFRKTMGKKVNRKFISVQGTYESQLRANPAMELRKRLQQAGMQRRIEAARKEAR